MVVLEVRLVLVHLPEDVFVPLCFQQLALAERNILQVSVRHMRLRALQVVRLQARAAEIRPLSRAFLDSAHLI